MPTTRSRAAKDVRKCLICEAKTTSLHLGVDACRACAVFYRRSSGKKPYACRSNTYRCPVNKDYGISCKRCRFDRIKRILGQTEAKNEAATNSLEVSAFDDSVKECSSTQNMHNIASTSRRNNDPDPSNESSIKSELLSKLDAAYKVMCFTRRTSELNARASPPHPMLVRSPNRPIYPCTFVAMMHGNRVLLTTILEFASTAFADFNTLSNDEQWRLTVNFFYRFRAFDSCYRAEKAFPNELKKSFGTFTTWLSEDMVDGFFDDEPNAGNIEEAKRIMGEKVGTRFAPARSEMKRIDPDEHEFLAMAGIMFWTTEGARLSDEIAAIGDVYRDQILRSLHAYYREKRGLTDYATRVGELFTLMMHYERVQDVREQFEILRLLDVVDEDNFSYLMHREFLTG